MTLIDEILHAYPGAYYLAEPSHPAPVNVAGVDLFDGVSLGKLWVLYATIGERRGLEPHGVQSYAERDWFRARRRARNRERE